MMRNFTLYTILIILISALAYNSGLAETVQLSAPEIYTVNNIEQPVNISGKVIPQATEYVATWTLDQPIAITDNESSWTTIVCDPNGLVTAGTAVTRVELYHYIEHTYIGDLDIQATNESTIWPVRFSDLNDNGKVIDETLTNSELFIGDDPNQLWYYQVRDVFSGDVGTLNEMVLKVYFANAEPDIALDINELEFDCSESTQADASNSNSYAELIHYDDSTQECQIIGQQEIENMFANDGTARIIVNLKNSLLADSKAFLTNGKTTKQYRAKVKAVRDSVLDSFKKKKDFKARYEFDNIPSFSASVTVQQLNQLLANENIASIEPVKKYKLLTAQGLPLMNAFDSRSVDSGAGISIAICDSGIDYTHPMLGDGAFPNDKVIGGYDFGDDDTDPMPYSNAHGTACAGIAAGLIGSSADYIGGVAPGAKLYALKVAEGTGELIYTDAIADSWDWCVTNQYADPNNPIMVISASLGSGSFSSICDGSSYLLPQAAQNAANAGITILAASGNDGYCDSIAEPACISNIISVGATYDLSLTSGGWCVAPESCVADSDTGCETNYVCYDTGVSAGDVSCYSNSAEILDVLAPSFSVTTTDITGSGGYDSDDYTEDFGGTSAACPYAAGAVAVIQQTAYNTLGGFISSSQVKNILINTGSQIFDQKSNLYKPLVDLGSALDSLIVCEGNSIDISNNGIGILTISGMDLPSWISTNQVFPIEIVAGDSISVCLVSDCPAICIDQVSYSDNITIYSDDPDTPALVLPVSVMCAACPSAPLGDISGDCIVDLNDLANLASTWLDCGYVPEKYCN